ncbi:MAG: hypothetical protein HY271_19405 [Deltaproteobacteria bacterium]|nr:hypothetical protein [Deltaproteobacteria bacterium]
MKRSRARAERRAAARNATGGAGARRDTSGSTPATAAPEALRRAALAMLAFLLVVTAFYAATSPAVGSDTWFTLAAGRYISEHGIVPSVDVFSYTRDGAPWFNQEWLTQVLFYQVFRIAGGNGLVALKVALVVILVLLMAWIGWRRSGTAVLGALTAMAGALVCRPYLDMRPHMFTFLGALVLLALTDSYRRRPRRAPLLGLPLLLFLWVNLHYGFIYGLGALALIAGVETARSLLDPQHAMLRVHAHALAAVAAAAAVACVLNPQHFHALTFPFTILEPASPWKQVLEWQPVVLFEEEPLNPMLFSYFFVAQLVAFAAALGCGWRRVDLPALALVGVTGVMAFQARRFVPLFAMVSAPFLAANLALVRERLVAASSRVPELRSRRATLAAGAFAILGLTWVAREGAAELPTFSDGIFEGMVSSSYFPRAAVEFLRRNPLPGRIYNLYNWGGYLMYTLPDRKVFIDGRAHEVYPSSFYYESATVESAEPGWENVLDRYEVSLILWFSHEDAEDTDLADLLGELDASPHWRRVYEDGRATVFAHVDRGRQWVESLEADTLVYPEGGEPQQRDSSRSRRDGAR